MLIDCHVHLFPDALAGRTLEHLASIAKMPYYTQGTVDDTLRRMDEAGVDISVVQHIATRPTQQKKINDFAASIQSDRIVCFGTVHPSAPDMVEELYRIRELGLHGVKLHPDYQDFFVDDPHLAPLYETAQKLKLPILMHTGFDPVSPQAIHGPAQAVAQVAHSYPELTLIAAHMGGLSDYDRAERYLVGSGVYLDLSMSSVYCPQEQFARMVQRHGAERLLFATDCPWSRAEDELKLLDTVPLTEQEKDMVCFGNALRILGME